MDNTDFSLYFNSPEELANKVLQFFWGDQNIIYPIDPFKMLSKFNVIYQLRNFDKLEGVYIVPENEDDFPVIGINYNRPITRQRFTAAHELCHHIKDKSDVYCPIYGNKNKGEKFADQFSAAILMPINELKSISDQYLKNGVIEFEDAIIIADYFGVSFEACVFRLAYKLHRISGDTAPSNLKRRIKFFKPDKKRIEFGLDKYNFSLLRNIIDSYEIFFPRENQIIWNRFKIDFIFNENRMEGLEIDRDEVSEIITDLRLHKQESSFCNSKYEKIIEVCGHSSLYDFINETDEKISAFSILRLNQLFYQFSPFPEAAGKFRNTNNYVAGSNFETSDHHDIPKQIRELDKEIQKLINNLQTISLSDFIDQTAKIHHRITVIHPFPDGNGRVSRAFLNWLFRLKGLPPIYIKLENKLQYYDALSYADKFGEYDLLIEILYREILRSIFTLNSKFL